MVRSPLVDPHRTRRRRRRARARVRLDVVGGDYRAGGLIEGGARLLYASADRKLAPVELVPHAGRPRPVPAGPYCAATYVSIEATCSSSCRFKAGACYVTAGFTAPLARKLDAAARASGGAGDDVLRAEADLLERAFGSGRVPQDGGRDGRRGRDLRLHVGGDASSLSGLHRLVWAVEDWQRRGGGAVWTYTHRWAEIPRAEWGPISVLASVETPRGAELARARGYVPAITLARFPGRRAFRLEGMSDETIPCPAETSKTTCVQCRLCLDADRLRSRRKAIGFALHGGGADKVRLPVVREVAA